MIRSGLPVDAVLPQIADAARACRPLVITAEPGAGKSTVVPLALLEPGVLPAGKIVMLEPRRIAARAAARRMASLLNEPPGKTVGYRTRFETLVSADTRIEVVTEALLTRMLQRDPSLEGVAAVIFDEFHERSIHADLALALTLDARSILRDDLRIALMSATLDANSAAGRRVVTAVGARSDVDRDLVGATAFVGVARCALEAMSCGLPAVIAGNYGALGVLDGDNMDEARASNFTARGRALPTSADIERDVCALLDMTDGERRTLGELGRGVVLREYSVDRMTRDYLRCWEKMCVKVD